jgi:hypothetical protein
MTNFHKTSDALHCYDRSNRNEEMELTTPDPCFANFDMVCEAFANDTRDYNRAETLHAYFSGEQYESLAFIRQVVQVWRDEHSCDLCGEPCPETLMDKHKPSWQCEVCHQERISK